jgi:Trypsin
MQGYISGFGYLAGNVLTDTMQYSQMLVWSRAECKHHYPEQGDFFTCAYSSSAITCSGDTGGAFVVYDNGAMRLIGISSKVFVVNGVCQSASGGGFVRMGAHKKWIEETAVDDPDDSCPVCPVCPI